MNDLRKHNQHPDYEVVPENGVGDIDNELNVHDDLSMVEEKNNMKEEVKKKVNSFHDKLLMLQNSFWFQIFNFYKWTLAMQATIFVSFVYTVQFFQDYATTTIYVIVWFVFAIVIDNMKAWTGGSFFEMIACIKNKSEGKLSKGITLFLIVPAYLCCMWLSQVCTVGAQLKSNRDVAIDKFNNSREAKQLKKLESLREQQSKSLMKLTDSLTSASNNDKELNKTELESRNKLDEEISQHREKVQEYNNRISIAVRYKKGHATLDRLKAEEQKVIESLKIDRAGINTNNSSSQNSILKQSKLMESQLDKTNAKIKAIGAPKENAENEINNMTVEKTALQILYKTEHERNVFSDKVGWIFEFLIIVTSYMSQRQRRLMGLANDINVQQFKVTQFANANVQPEIPQNYNRFEYKVDDYDLRDINNNQTNSGNTVDNLNEKRYNNELEDDFCIDEIETEEQNIEEPDFEFISSKKESKIGGINSAKRLHYINVLFDNAFINKDKDLQARGITTMVKLTKKFNNGDENLNMTENQCRMMLEILKEDGVIKIKSNVSGTKSWSVIEKSKEDVLYEQSKSGEKA
ncbi:MAG: hypothetical protein ACM3O3_12905 [Syntrophothermus sp.]